MKQVWKIGFLLCVCSLLSTFSLYAETPITFKVSVIVASNEGSDIDLENDFYRDQLLHLFSYKAYKQVSQSAIQLTSGKSEALGIAGEYQVMLTLKSWEKEKAVIVTAIRKANQVYLDTEVSLTGSAPVFLGGPPFDSGNLILVVERIS